MKKVLLSGLFSVLFAGNVWGGDLYQLDPIHSDISFYVTHLQVSRVKGQFRDFDGAIEFDSKDVFQTQVRVTINVDSIDTRYKERDDHLRSSDFFKVQDFPRMTFMSRGIKKHRGDFIIFGDLTIKGVTRRVEFPCIIVGPIQHRNGDEILGLTGSLTVNRLDYGITWNQRLDAGGYLVSNDVEIVFSIQARKRK